MIRAILRERPFLLGLVKTGSFPIDPTDVVELTVIKPPTVPYRLSQPSAYSVISITVLNFFWKSHVWVSFPLFTPCRLTIFISGPIGNSA